MNKTKFVSVDDTQKEKKETVFTHELEGNNGWITTSFKPSQQDKVIYLGKCDIDGDMFVAYSDGGISIFKGTKGDEFQTN